MSQSGVARSSSSGGGGGAGTITGDTGGPLSQTGSNWNILGAHGINTSGSGSTLTVAINNAITLGDLTPIAGGSPAITLTTGDVVITAGSLRLSSTTSSTKGLIFQNGNRFLHTYADQTNLFLGVGSGNFTNTSSHSTGIGFQSLAALTTGVANTALGENALNIVTTGAANTAIGAECMFNATGSNNTAIGELALNASTGSQNTVTGAIAAGGLAGASSDNCAYGYASISALTSGVQNSCFGSLSTQMTTGSYNTCIGYKAGFNYTTSEGSNILIGHTVLGTTGESNIIRIGSQGSGTGQQLQTYIAGVINTVSGRVVKTTVPGAYPYTTLTTDYVILVDTASARTINLVATPVTGTTYRIKDNVGSGALNNITITPAAGTIDGAASFVVNSNWGSIDCTYNGTSWRTL